MASAAFVSRGAASFCRRVCFPFSPDLSRLCSREENEILVVEFERQKKTKKSTGLCSVPLLCFHFLFACHTVAQRHACALLLLQFGIFLTCLQFFLHTLSFPNKQKNRKKRVTQFGGIPQTYFNLLTRCLKKWHIWQHSCNLWEKVMHVYPWTVHKLSGTIIFFWVILEWYRQPLWRCTFQCHHSHPH